MMETITVNNVEITLDAEDGFKTTIVKRTGRPDQECGIIWYIDLSGKRKRVYTAPDPAAWRKRWMKLRDELSAGKHSANRAALSKIAQEALDYRERFIGLPNGLRSQSHENDVRHIRKHIVPEIGDKQIAKITVGDVNFFIDHLHMKGLSPKTQRSVVHTLNMVMKFALDKGYIFSNPCARDVRRRIEGDSGERDGYDAKEVRAILETAQTDYSKTLFSFAALTGLAANELQGLLWDCVDLKKGFVEVKRTGYRGALQDTKTKFRIRTIPMPAQLTGMMREWKLRCPSDTFVFPSAGNIMADQKHWVGLLKTICKHAKVEYKGVGGFRKFYHTQMELDGVPESIRKYRMGHSKRSNTAKAHYTVTDLEQAQTADDAHRIAGRIIP